MNQCISPVSPQPIQDSIKSPGASSPPVTNLDPFARLPVDLPASPRAHPASDTMRGCISRHSMKGIVHGKRAATPQRSDPSGSSPCPPAGIKAAAPASNAARSPDDSSIVSLSPSLKSSPWFSYPLARPLLPTPACSRRCRRGHRRSCGSRSRSHPPRAICELRGYSATSRLRSFACTRCSTCPRITLPRASAPSAEHATVKHSPPCRYEQAACPCSQGYLGCFASSASRHSRTTCAAVSLVTFRTSPALRKPWRSSEHRPRAADIA